MLTSHDGRITAGEQAFIDQTTGLTSMTSTSRSDGNHLSDLVNFKVLQAGDIAIAKRKLLGQSRRASQQCWRSRLEVCGLETRRL